MLIPDEGIPRVPIGRARPGLVIGRRNAMVHRLFPNHGSAQKQIADPAKIMARMVKETTA